MKRPYWHYSWSFLLCMFVGAIAVIIFQLCDITPFDIGPFDILLGHLALMILPITITLANRHDNLKYLWLFSILIGVWSADFLSMILQAEGMLLETKFSSVLNLNLLGFTTVAIVGLVILRLLTIRNYEVKKSRRHNSPYISIITLCLTILCFRAYHFYMICKGIPNVERSIMVANIEIHHIAWGSIGLYAFGLVLFVNPHWIKKNISAAIMGGLFAFIADEALYYCLDEVTDVSYGEVTSFLGAIIFAAIYCIWILIISNIHTSKTHLGFI
jgi:hypothetical protein